MSADPSNAPRPQDFGISPDVLENMRLPFCQRHRHGVCATLVVLALGSATGLLWYQTASFGGALIVATALVAASLVVLLPAAVAASYLAERIEIRWRSAHDPTFAACASFRGAERRHLDHCERWRARSAVEEQRWLVMRLPELVTAVTRHMASDGWSLQTLDRWSTGADLQARAGETVAIVRIEPGPTAPPPAAARELLAACVESDADRGILVAPAGLRDGCDRPKSSRILIWNASTLATFTARAEI